MRVAVRLLPTGSEEMEPDFCESRFQSSGPLDDPECGSSGPGAGPGPPAFPGQEGVRKWLSTKGGPSLSYFLYPQPRVMMGK